VDRPVNNDDVIEEASELLPGQVVVLLHPRLQAKIDGWLIWGDLDVLRLERRPQAGQPGDAWALPAPGSGLSARGGEMRLPPSSHLPRLN
jgi:hypothetical protein